MNNNIKQQLFDELFNKVKERYPEIVFKNFQSLFHDLNIFE